MNNNIKKYFIKDPETPLHVKDNDPNKCSQSYGRRLW